MENALELDRWTLSDAERGLILSKSTSNRLALLLKYFVTFGRFPASLAEIAGDAAQHVAAQLALGALRTDSLQEPQERTVERYRAEIRTFFGFREATSADAQELTTWLRPRRGREPGSRTPYGVARGRLRGGSNPGESARSGVLRRLPARLRGRTRCRRRRRG